MRKVLVERRKIKNDMELLRVLHQHENKLINKANRQLLLNYIGKTNKALLNSEYGNRVYTKEEIEELVGG